MTTDIAAEKYVLMTTYKKDGSAGPTPVWIAELNDGRLGFTTDADSWKVKRINANPEVTLRPCDMKGNVADDAGEFGGQAVVLHGSEVDEVRAAIKGKYGFQVTLIQLFSKLKALVGRSSSPPVAVVISLDK